MTITDELLELENRRLTAINTRDLAKVAEVYDDDIVFVHSTGLVEDKEQVLHDAAHGPARAYVLGECAVTDWGDFARLVGDVHMTVTPKDRAPIPLHMYVTRIARKRGGVWRYVSLHVTRITV